MREVGVFCGAAGGAGRAGMRWRVGGVLFYLRGGREPAAVGRAEPPGGWNYLFYKLELVGYNLYRAVFIMHKSGVTDH